MNKKFLAIPFFLATVVFASFVGSSPLAAQQVAQQAEKEESTERIEPRFLSNIRQLTFEGRRAGEGYFSPDGRYLVFQSERVEGNPFFQIFLMDMETGDVEQISPGIGKTTCAWVHPSNRWVLYASTQDDPEAVAKQKQEIEFRETGQSRRYSWDYDPWFELYAFDRETREYNRLTNVRGYDAEGSYSPDGKLIAFASNRNAYTQPMTEDQRKKFEIDPAVMMDIFIMNADGTDVRQLTDTPGYDGGPFFSPDGKRICWRRFSENGATAEIMTMNIDGSDQKQITHLGAMSWAPFYHPSGKYLIFTTNRHGFGNFELYLVDVEGRGQPVRVTDTDGFDGLASFSPDGTKLTWTSNRNDRKESQIYLADWNHDAALAALAISNATEESAEAELQARENVETTRASFDPRDIMRHVDFLCRPELEGRLTGTRGERMATAYVAAYLDSLGLEPAGDNGTWFQEFEFPAGTRLGPNNRLTLEFPAGVTPPSMEVDRDWRPLAFSATGHFDPAEIVYAGYGIVAPAEDGQDEYDSYVHLDVTDKWVMIFRYMPENISPERRQYLQYHASLRKKAMEARERGARGIIVVSGPNSGVRNQLVPLASDFTRAGSSLAAISVTDELAHSILAAAGKDLKALQDQADTGEPVMGFPLRDVRMEAEIDVASITGKGRNVIGRLKAAEEPSDQVVLVGAHVDHLGRGQGGSLAKEDERGQIHFGADDNASGVAAMLEIAEYMAKQKRDGKLNLKRDILFAAWSGEELGLYGSQHFVKQWRAERGAGQTGQPTQPAPIPAGANPHDITLDQVEKLIANAELNRQRMTADELKSSLVELSLLGQFLDQGIQAYQAMAEADGPDHRKAEVRQELERMKSLRKRIENVVAELKPMVETGQGGTSESLYPEMVAALNMDMVGRMQKQLVLQGVSSSNYWKGEVERRNAVLGLPIKLSGDTQLPTDAASFYRAGVPILSAFTGSHADYHTPRDTPEKLNYPDAARIANLMGLVARGLATTDRVPDYVRQTAEERQPARGVARAWLGTVPDYAGDVKGVLLSDVASGGPAEKAGVRGGDIIVELAGKKVENIYDYTYAIEALKVGQETTISVMRDGKTLQLKITPTSRD